MTGQSGGISEMVKIASTNWKSLDEDEKQNYSERAKKICAELRDNFKKLTSDEKQDLWVEHIVKKAKRRRFRMKKKLRKFYAETNRPKHPSRSYILFVKERFEKQTEPFKTRDKVRKFVAETAQQWRQMTDAEKQPYVDQGQCNIAAYNVELAEWKQKYANEIRAWNEAMDKAARKGWRKKKLDYLIKGTIAGGGVIPHIHRSLMGKPQTQPSQQKSLLDVSNSQLAMHTQQMDRN
uniref:HMG box domain-containing protein n=1 Tax=Globodera pallida TaxID=36090 RepID=A0A183BIK3_GLOPA